MGSVVFPIETDIGIQHQTEMRHCGGRWPSSNAEKKKSSRKRCGKNGNNIINLTTTTFLIEVGARSTVVLLLLSSPLVLDSEDSALRASTREFRQTQASARGMSLGDMISSAQILEESNPVVTGIAEDEEWVSMFYELPDEDCNVDLYSSELRIKFDHARLSDQSISTSSKQDSRIGSIAGHRDSRISGYAG